LCVVVIVQLNLKVDASGLIEDGKEFGCSSIPRGDRTRQAWAGRSQKEGLPLFNVESAADKTPKFGGPRDRTAELISVCSLAIEQTLTYTRIVGTLATEDGDSRFDLRPQLNEMKSFFEREDSSYAGADPPREVHTLPERLNVGP
jgi:hypothetical protein